MNETAVTEINADVREGFLERIEEDKVARLQLIDRNGLAQLADGACPMRQRQIGRLVEHVAYEPAAIEAGFRRNSPELVRRAAQGERTQQDFLHGGTSLLHGRRGLTEEAEAFGRSIFRVAGVGGEAKHGCQNKGI
jgi:hypothetical protein